MLAGSRAYTLGLLMFLGTIAAAHPVQAQITELVNQVSQSNIQSHIAALEGERYTAEELATTAAYIRAQLESYGYTVTSDPVGISENLDPHRSHVLGDEPEAGWRGQI
jgi:recombinational DNA repair protein RecR